ncbi:MAG: hypothetical protein QOE11_2739 [Solirubrobacteraceae bacterium]|nr:hypothetical protein [Solirubrobacteraceae bacterium]
MIPASPKFGAPFATLGATCLLALVPVAAQADPYAVDFCRHQDGTPAAAFGTLAGVTANECGIAGGALRKHIAASPGPPVGTHEYIGLSVPDDRPNIRIEHLLTDWEVPGATNTMFAFTPIYASATPAAPLQTEVFNGQPPIRTTVDVALPAGTRAVQWDMYCGGGAGTCSFTPDTPAGTVSVVNVYGTRLTLNEGVAPTATVTGGSLSGAGAKRGQMSLVFDAADTDSGVASGSVTLDGTVVGSANVACVSNDWSVCPRTDAGQTVTADTTKVPDGDHVLALTVRDAANNAVTQSLGTVTVANAATPATLPNGANPSRQAKIGVRFTTTKRTSRRLGFTSSPTIKGLLVNESAQPITGATVAVFAHERRSGARSVQIATTQTGADGAFAYRLPGGPSRTITFAYTAFGGDPAPATSASLKTTVRAQVSAAISPRSVRPGGRITMTGRLRLLPRRGVDVKIQARQGRAWRLIDGVRTDATGRFRWRYHFASNQARRTYQFRARVSSPLYPFAAGNSKPARVRVR